LNWDQSRGLKYSLVIRRQKHFPDAKFDEKIAAITAVAAASR
jgi:hypothetical protein